MDETGNISRWSVSLKMLRNVKSYKSETHHTERGLLIVVLEIYCYWGYLFSLVPPALIDKDD